jgi:hypothetical protein
LTGGGRCLEGRPAPGLAQSLPSGFGRPGLGPQCGWMRVDAPALPTPCLPPWLPAPTSRLAMSSTRPNSSVRVMLLGGIVFFWRVQHEGWPALRGTAAGGRPPGLGDTSVRPVRRYDTVIGPHRAPLRAPARISPPNRSLLALAPVSPAYWRFAGLKKKDVIRQTLIRRITNSVSESGWRLGWTGGVGWGGVG